MRTVTVGQLIVNSALPPDLRDYDRVLDKKGLKELLREVLDRYPEQYKDVVHRLNQIGADAAFSSGSSFSIKDLRSSRTKRKAVARIEERLRLIENDPAMSDEQKDAKIINLLAKSIDSVREGTHAEGLAEDNSFSRAIASGARGNPANLSSLRGADLLVLDHKDRPIPVPILSNYSEGLSPAEYFAASYGTRKGVVATKMSTAQAGFLNKQLVNAAGRLLITDETPLEGTGYPVDTDDEDNEGVVLARDYGRFKAGTIISPSILRELRKTDDEILVHSPVSAGGTGVPQLAAGIRERGGWSPIGDNVGIASAQALGEPLSQSQLSSKHSAGVIGASKETGIEGFRAINQLVQIPKSFQHAATVSTIDGHVESVDEAPQGGKYVWVGGERHYVRPEIKTTVKVGDTIEAGDVLSEGIPNPAEMVKHKHIGEGRRYLVNQLRKTLAEQGIGINRRNLELIARGLVNHVRVVETDGVEGALPDDIISYDELARTYQPRFGNMTLTPSQAKHKFLEKPVLHYSIGTRMTPSVIKRLRKHKVGSVIVHTDPPPFEPHMVRAMETSLHDLDFMRRLGGFYIGKGFLSSVHRGGKSQVHGQNWGHSLAEAKDFGRELETKGVY